jgi:hypothetical protein
MTNSCYSRRVILPLAFLKISWCSTPRLPETWFHYNIKSNHLSQNRTGEHFITSTRECNSLRVRCQILIQKSLGNSPQSVVDSNSLMNRLKVSALLDILDNTWQLTVTLTQGVGNLPFKTDPVNVTDQQWPWCLITCTEAGAAAPQFKGPRLQSLKVHQTQSNKHLSTHTGAAVMAKTNHMTTNFIISDLLILLVQSNERSWDDG